jgi:hypothetical protein
MSKTQKDLAKQELEKLYDNQYRWVQAGEALRGRFDKALKENPKLKLILILSITSNVGIWLTLILLNF